MNDPATVSAGSDSTERKPVIEIRDLEKTYEDGGINALNGVDLVVRDGELVAITGPSGCGKSTLLHLMAGLDRPTRGSIHVHGYDLGHLRHPNRFRRQEIGLVFQLHNLLPRLTVLGNVEVAMIGTNRSRSERKAHAMELLSDVDLDGLANRKPPQLSGGGAPTSRNRSRSGERPTCAPGGRTDWKPGQCLRHDGAVFVREATR